MQRVDLPQLEHLAQTARRPDVDHLEILLDRSTDEIVSYVILDRTD